MALINTFHDNFDDNSLSASWTDWGGAQTNETNNEMEFTSTLASGYYGIDTATTYDLTASSVSVKVANKGDQTITSFELYPMNLKKDANNALLYIIAGNSLQARKNVAGVTSTLQSATYSATNHKYLKIRESGGTTFWETSPDGFTWNSFTSAANPITITALTLQLFIGTWQVEGSTTTAALDNVNVVQGSISESDKYTIRTSVPVTKSDKYTIRTSVPVTKSEKYTVRTSIGITKSDQYAVLLTPAITKDVQYIVQAAPVITESAKYTILTTPAVTKSEQYALLMVRATTKTDKYTVLKSIQNTKSDQYAVLKTYSITESLQYVVTVITIVDTTKSTKYCVRTGVPVLKGLQYEIQLPNPPTVLSVGQAVIYSSFSGSVGSTEPSASPGIWVV